jgi:hypothetical protein
MVELRNDRPAKNGERRHDGLCFGLKRWIRLEAEDEEIPRKVLKFAVWPGDA